jgi:hypothetical protein
MRKLLKAARALFRLGDRQPTPLPPPKPLVCVGRDALCADISKAAETNGCVLLFGGRQSGKTTVLQRIQQLLTSPPLAVGPTERVTIPVMVDLMRLHYDAGPREVFQMLGVEAKSACEKRIPGIRADHVESRDLGSFEHALGSLRRAANGVDLTFLFLVDESKRVLGERFPRGFRDNLFALLYGSSPTRGYCSMVLAGAQELYAFAEDGTSPIASRAAKQFITNLQAEALAPLVEQLSEFGPELARQYSEVVYQHTGGHAGLSSQVARALFRNTGTPDVEAEINRVGVERSELFQIWIHTLSLEARVTQERLLEKTQIDIAETARCLQQAGRMPYRADRAWEELQFTGIATRRGDTLFLSNKLYATTAKRYTVNAQGTDEEQVTWGLIEQVEVSLRRRIRAHFTRRWSAGADHKIADALGNQAWSKIEENRTKAASAYRYSPPAASGEVLDFAYLGQLGILITWKQSWDMFAPMFRDKRELEDMIREIGVVRTERAHFRTVPQRELARCKLRCQDLLAVLDRTPI